MEKEGKWKPYDVKNILKNIELVFKTNNMNKLSKKSYDFLYQMDGFIAHYDIHGFKQHYSNVIDLIKKLDSKYYLSDAQRDETDKDFNKWYGSEYNKSVAEIKRGLVALARKYRNQAEEIRNNSVNNKLEVLEEAIKEAKRNPEIKNQLVNSLGL